MKSTPRARRRGARVLPALAGLLAFGLAAATTGAQPLPQPAPPVAPVPAPAQPPPGAQPAPPGGAAAPAAPAARPDSIAAALSARPGGLTPEDVGRTAARTRPSLRVKQAELRAAAARVDQALVNYFPRVTLTATYTRLSEVDSGLGGGQGSIVGINAPPGGLFVGPCPGDATRTCLVDSTGAQAAGAVPFSIDFPSLNNSYSLVASIAVPISDYVLRVSQGYAAASHAESAARLQAEAEALTIASDAKIAFFNWVRARGQVVVAREAVAQAQAHLVDARRTLEVGLISRADVLRLEAQVASAQQVEAEAAAFLSVADEQLRIAMGAPPERTFEVGIDVMAPPGAPPAESLQALQQEAFQNRLEIRSLDETQHSLKEAESVAQAAYLPRVDAFANFTYANPNQRIFPQREEFNLTWEAGVRMTWTVNDTFTAMGTVAEAKARTAVIVEQKAALRDGLRLEVASAHADVTKAASSIEAAARQLVAAEESMRVRTELFRAGRATSVDLVDAETEVTRARLRHLDAHVGLLVARARLDHAVGRDAKRAAAGGGPRATP